MAYSKRFHHRVVAYVCQLSRKKQVGPIPRKPGPGEEFFPLNAGLDNATIAFNSATGIVILGIVAQNNGAGVPAFGVTWRGEAMALLGREGLGGVGQPYLALYGIKGQTGTGNVVISATSGSAGNAIVRVEDLAALTDGFPGVVASEVSDNYYWEAVMSGRSYPAYLCMSGSADARAYPITADGDIDEVWQTTLAGERGTTVARFAHSVRPTNQDEYFVSYPRVTCHGAVLAVEMPGLEFPA